MHFLFVLYYEKKANMGNVCLGQVSSQVIPLLVDMIQQPDSRQPENINPTENAISAVTKILKFNSSACNLDQILPVWCVHKPLISLYDLSIVKLSTL